MLLFRPNAASSTLQVTPPGATRWPRASAVMGLFLTLGLVALVPATEAQAAGTQAKTSKKAASPTVRRTKAPAPPPKPEPAAEPLSEQQLEVANRVQIGSVDCEFEQKVELLAVAEQPGLFHLRHGGKRYTMVPQPTSSGAVRLEDAKAGIVWLQIPAKSMLMNTRIGQRMVDNCQNAAQLADQALDLVVAQAASAAGQAPAPGLLSGTPPAVGEPAASSLVPEEQLLLDW